MSETDQRIPYGPYYVWLDRSLRGRIAIGAGMPRSTMTITRYNDIITQ